MLRTLDRYLIKAFFYNYFMSLVVLISLYVVLDLFVNMDEFTEDGQGVHEVVINALNYYGYNIPLYFAQMSGVITAFAGCGVLARMQRQNEITAVLSSGTSTYRLAAPIIVAGLAMNLLLVVDNEVILPNIAPKLARQRDDVEGARISQVWFVKDGNSRLISAQQFSPVLQTIRNLIVMELSPDPDTQGSLRNVVTADKATWNAERKGWELARGIRFSANREANDVFGQHYMNREPLDFYPCTLDPEQIRLRQRTQWVEYLSTSQLNSLAASGDISRIRIAQVKHARFTAPISNMILLLLGISFFLNRLPTSILTQGAKALATCAVSMLVAFAGQQLAGTMDLSPALPAWIPVFLFGPLAILLLDNVKT